MIRLHIDRQDPCRLRRIHDKRYAVFERQLPDLTDRQAHTEYVGGMCTYDHTGLRCDTALKRLHRRGIV